MSQSSESVRLAIQLVSNDSSNDDGGGLEALLNATYEKSLYNQKILADLSKACTALGIIALVINATILAILSRQRRRVLQQAFYLLIINFAIIDALKGTCLTLHSLRLALPQSIFKERNIGTKIDQYLFIFYRLFNLVTVFNLLMITLNEFVFIKFPLRYHQLVRTKFVLLLVFLSWIISIGFTVAYTFAKSLDTEVYVNIAIGNYSLDDNSTSLLFSNMNTSNSTPRRTAHPNLRRRGLPNSDNELSMILTLALTGFCLFSLIVVLICYCVFFQMIREIKRTDKRLQVDANRRPSETSLTSTEFQHLDERKIKRQLLKRYKYVLVIGSVILVYMLYLISYSSIQILQYLNVKTQFASTNLSDALITRGVLVLLCGVHSIVQPTCYFRMREFREMFTRIFRYTCRGGRRRDDQFAYFSSFADTPMIGQTTTNNNNNNNHNNRRSINDEQLNRRRSTDRRSASATSNEIKYARKASVVHFDEGSIMTVCQKKPNMHNGSQV